jgi:glycosyltransferase involved in cell wall biosynthesis
MKVLFIGPLPPPFNGQSIAFSYVCSLNSDELSSHIFNTTKNKYKLINYLNNLIVLPIKIFLGNFDKIYFTGSRTTKGFLLQFPFLIISKLKKCYLINHLHGADFKIFYEKSFLKQIIKIVYGWVGTSIVLIEEMKMEFVDFPKMNLEVLNNAYSPEFDLVKINFPKDKKLSFISNIMASKGIMEFLKASRILLEKYDDLKINIAGSFVGDEYKSKSQIRKDFYKFYHQIQRDFSNRINFFNTVSGQDKIDLFAQSSIFILPTYYKTEASPISILEAMRTGNVIITTRHNYLKYLISESNGSLIDIKSPKKIIKAVSKLFDNSMDLQQIQKNNISYAKKHFNIKNYYRSMLEILKKNHVTL